MKEFLRQVAEHWLAQGGMDKCCFIFPNRRSLAFFRKYLSDAVKDSGKGPLRAPVMLTMNDFFYRMVGARPTGRVSLLLELWHCYEGLKKTNETLDDFIFWGDVLLADFDDVDKYLVDASGLFANVSDFKNIQDSYEYLDENQRAALERFLKHFDPGRNSASDADGKAGIKEKFRQVWDILLDLYRSFNASLDAKGMCYEGKVYRALAERLREESVSDILGAAMPGTASFVFVGLNALNECEKRLMSRMRDAGLASFCWDWADGWISDRRNKSSVFMAQNVLDFPQAFVPEAGSAGDPEINVLSVPSSIGQAKQLPDIFQRLADENQSGDMSRLGIETAVVLPDENLLVPVLNSIPPRIKDINVTMGYPMGASGFYALMTEVCALQMHLRQKNGGWLFYHKQVHAIFSNGIFRAAVSEESLNVVAEIKAASQYYVPQESFGSDPVMKAIFRPVVKDPKLADADIIRSLGEYLRDVVSTVALRLKEIDGMAAETGFAKEYYTCVTRLESEELPVLPATYFRLLSQMLAQSAVPFSGEPLKGLQVMGPLETRTLDFRNLVILSVNEGVFPRRSVSSSFIPPELRKGFGLPTYEFQDAVWAYYFYRLLIRADKVWMLFDSRSEGLKSGEESRYIKQLELHFGAKVRRMVAKAAASTGEDAAEIVKTVEDVDIIRNKYLSATALQNYLYCPAKFYYHTVKGLMPEEEVAESLDAGMIGSVFHDTMCAIYMGEYAMAPDFPLDRESLKTVGSNRHIHVSRSYVESWMNRPSDIKARIGSFIMRELHSFEVSGRNIVFADVVLEYVLKVLSRDLELMREHGLDGFDIIGLEIPRFWEFCGFKFIGFIDRLDSFVPGTVRVVDYKTGKVEDADININDFNAEAVLDKLFGPSNASRPKIALQMFLYDMFVEDLVPAGGKVVNSIYSPSRLFVTPVEEVDMSPAFVEGMKERLSSLLVEISDVNEPFRLTADKKTCQYCDFKNICGR
ncbi:MAG: PD-(D/E)XK nuclease family protein [Bacteroidia bacterium]|nr:PD-(D/E)XK nuclease family protein [Bacteroidia bacterium]